MWEDAVRFHLVLALTAALAACGGEEPHTPSCPEWFRDLDGDGFGDGAAGAVTHCDPIDGYVGNPYDCDDLDADVHPLAPEFCDPDDVDEDCNGVADNDDENALGRTVEAWRDADGDGHAVPTIDHICDMTAGWSPTRGRDCDDADPAVNPDTPDPIDGVDTNCDGFDGPAIYEDFESGGPDPAMWSSAEALLPYTSEAPQGRHAARMAPASEAETIAIDTSGCGALAWHYQVTTDDLMRADTALRLDYWDGTAWQPLDEWVGDGDGHWRHRWGELEDPAALRPDFRVKLVTTQEMDDDHAVDHLMVGCRAQSDDDGVPDGVDCAPADPLHWFDCGACTDLDGDGAGPGCDRGRDCDDEDAAVHPGAEDAPGDGLDTDCSQLDGPGFHDDFDAGPDATMWQPLVRAEITSEAVVSPPNALEISRSGEAVTPPLDLSSCADGIWWEYQAKPLTQQGWSLPLVLSWEGADGWAPIDEWPSSLKEADFRFRWGAFYEPAAARQGVRFQLAAVGQRWWVDDFLVTCLVDEDGDGVHETSDCAPADPMHWSDCGACNDPDGDGRGSGCDLGGDCDESSAAIYPHAPDASVDGTDQDCNGVDGVPLAHDDFAPDGLDPAIWGAHDVQFYERTPWSPDAFVELWHSSGFLEAAPVDSTACPALGWGITASGSGGAYPPELVLEHWDGAAWSELERWVPPDNYVGWGRHVGTSSDPALLRPDLRVRLRGETQYGYLQIDEVALGCAPP